MSKHPFDAVVTAAREKPARIVLPEGGDLRVIEAAAQAASKGTAQPVLIGAKAEIHALASQHNIDLAAVECIDNTAFPERDTLAQELFNARQHRGMTLEAARDALNDDLVFACLLVRCSFADGCVAGAVYPTAEVVRTAMQLVGKADGANFVSSFFVMLDSRAKEAAQRHAAGDTLVFADCALVIEPDAEQLAEIAIQTGISAGALLGMEPRIGMLSFSTAGSAKHRAVEKVQQATELARIRKPEWCIVGDIQLDAAIVPEIVGKKAPDMADSLKGQSNTPQACNILIFPSLDAGNIGYKLCERFGGRDAIGPVLQGLAKPVNDLSRGCKVDDIVNIIAVTSVQAGQET